VSPVYEDETAQEGKGEYKEKGVKGVILNNTHILQVVQRSRTMEGKRKSENVKAKNCMETNPVCFQTLAHFSQPRDHEQQ
jgi:hypothetical protein